MKHPIYYKSFEAVASEDGNYVEGYASVFDNIDLANEVVERTAWTKTLSQRNSPVRFLWQHKADMPIGVIEWMAVDQIGLKFRARFDDTTAGQDARKALLNDSVNKFSIGYRKLIEKARTINGRVVKALVELALHEISIVTFPCNELAVLTAVKAADEGETLSPENSTVLARIAKLMMDEQRAASPDVAEDAPEEPTEGEEATEPDTDADEDQEPADEAAEADEENPEKPASEDDDEEEKTRKAVSDLALRLKLNNLLDQIRA